MAGLVTGAVAGRDGLAWAQPGEAPAGEGDPREAAKEAFAAGERAFLEGDAQGALAHFERAFALRPHDAVRFNIAVCLEALGRHAEAIAQYQAAAESSVLSAEERQRAERAAEAALPNVGTLIVEGGDGGVVEVEGSARCNAPCRVLLDPGRHEASFARGAQRVRIEVEIQRGRDFLWTPPVSSELRGASAGPVPPAPPIEVSSFEPSWLTWVGGSVGLVGAAGIIGFGLHASSLHDEYERQPTRDGLEDGETFRDLTNVAIGVAALGGVLVAIDLVFLAPRSAPPAPSSALLTW